MKLSRSSFVCVDSVIVLEILSLLSFSSEALRRRIRIRPSEQGRPNTTFPGAEAPEDQPRPPLTRRDFIAGAGIGVAATAIVGGGIAVATRQGVQTVPHPAVVPRCGRRHTFGFAGTFTYRCSVHLDMQGTIVVVP